MKKILLVDDKPISLEIGIQIFKTAGIEVVTASNGVEGLNKMGADQFDVVVTNLVMPVMDGYSFCFSIRQGSIQVDVPVIIYSTTFTNTEHEAYAYAVGADKYITNPTGMVPILDAVNKLLSGDTKRRYQQYTALKLQDVIYQYGTWLIDKLENKNELFNVAKDELSKSEARFRTLLEHSTDVLLLADEHGRIIYNSPAAKQLLGYNIEETLGKQAVDLFHDDDKADVVARLKFAAQNPGKPIFRSNRMRHKAGHYIWTEGTTINLLHDPHVNAVVGSFREITDKKDTADKNEINEIRLEAERKKIADLFEQAPSYICILSGPDLVYEMANPLYLQITGKKDIIGKKAIEVFPELEAQGFLHLITEVYRTGVPFAANEVAIKLLDEVNGGYVEHFMNFVYQPYRDDAGNVAGVFFFANLVTDMVRVREEISVKEKRFRALVEHGSDAVAILDAHGTPTYVSPSFSKLLGYNEEEARGINLFEITHPDDLEDERMGMLEIMQHPGVVFEGRISRLKHRNGAWRWYEATITNLLHDPLINGIVDNFRDITDRKLAEEKIEHASRLYAFLSQINKAIVHIDNGAAVFEEACNIAHNVGKFSMAWIGMVDKDRSMVNLVASKGVPEDDKHLFSNIIYRPEGGIGHVMRTKTSFVCNNIEEHDGMKPWAPYANLRKLKSVMILPLKLNGEIIATFNLYAGEYDFFDHEEIDLLEEVSNDISFALEVLEKEKIRKGIEAKLVHNELRFKQAQAIAHVGSWELDLKANLFIWSEEACRIYGIPPDENIFSYESWLEFIHPEDREDVLKAIEQSASALSSISFNHRIVRKDGAVKHIYSEAHYEFDEYGIPIGMYGVGHDVTKAKEAEEKIVNVSRLYAFISQINQAIVQVTDEIPLFEAVCEIARVYGKFDLSWISLWDEDIDELNVVAYCNISEADLQWLRNTKYKQGGPVASVLRNGVIAIVNDIVNESANERFKQYCISRGFKSAIILPLKKGGKVIGAFNLLSSHVGLFDDEEVLLLTEATNDISFALDVFEKERHRKEMEEEIMRSEANLKNAQAIAHFGSWDIDFITGSVVWSEETCRIFGIPLEDRYTQSFDSWISHIHPDDVAHILKVTKESETTLAPCMFYHKIVRKSGEVRHVFSEARYIINKEGKAIGLTGVVHDITDTKEAQESLKRSEENLRMIMDVIPQYICAKNFDGKYVFVNSSYAKLYDTTPDAIIGKYLRDVMPAESDPDRIIEENRVVVRSGKMLVIPEEKFFDSNGKLKLFYTIKVPFTVAGTNEIALLSVSLDITEQKAAEAERTKIINDIVQRNKDLEQFSYIVSHNLRSPVANIMGLTSVLTDVDLDRSMQIDLMGDLTMSAQKLDNVISDLNSILGLKHTENKQKELVRFSTLMQDIQVSMESLIKENEVKIISDFSAIDELFTLKSYLYSIFYNLLSNSIKYRRANAAPVLEVTSAKDHNKVALTFKDNGLGIDLKKRGDEVFGLYKRFHTHVNGKGMGLFMVKTQVESLGGTISIESEVNKGTTFTVEFELS